MLLVLEGVLVEEDRVVEQPDSTLADEVHGHVERLRWLAARYFALQVVVDSLLRAD
jgi:hypothetical protein